MAELSPALPPLPPLAEISRIGIVGTGVIGAGWIAVFISRGYAVTAYVRSDASEAKCLKAVKVAWGNLMARGLATEADGWRRLVCVRSIEECVRSAHLVQESVVEDVATKQCIVAEIDRHAPPATLISTSSSFLPRCLVALKCTEHPERVVTGHPSIPAWDKFVEVLGSTAEQTAWLGAFYRECGMVVVEMRQETYGHVLNWLIFATSQAASMQVLGGFCSLEDMDKATLQLGQMLVAGGGLTTTMVGMVGGGSKEALDALSADITAGAPLSMAACQTSRWFGIGPWATQWLRLVQAVYLFFFGSGVVRRLVNRWVSWANAGFGRRFDALTSQLGSSEAYMQRVLDRMVSIEKRTPPIPMGEH